MSLTRTSTPAGLADVVAHPLREPDPTPQPGHPAPDGPPPAPGGQPPATDQPAHDGPPPATGHPADDGQPSHDGGTRFSSGAWPLAIRRFPTLTVSTPRLLVRPVTAEDAAPVAEIFADRQTRRWLPIPREYGQIDGTAWCTEMAEERRGSGTGDHYAVVRREDERVVGCLWTKRTDWVARMTEISYAVCPQLRGFGVAAEAVDGLAIALILERGFQRIEMRVAPGNIASRRVAEKAGFSYEGLLRNAAHVHTGRVDLEVWSLVAADLR